MLILNKNLLELIRFAAVGAVSFVIDLGLLVVFQKFVFRNVVNGVLISAALSFTISLIIHYFLASLWVFREHQVDNTRAHAIAGVLFVITNLVGLGINELAMWVGVAVLTIHYAIVKLVATAVVTAWNYLCQKLYIFKGKGVRNE